MKKFDVERLAPPGFPIVTEQALFWIGIGLAFLYSLLFFAGLFDAVYDLYHHYTNSQKVLISSAVMPDFKDLLGPYLGGFPTLACSMVLFALAHYKFFFWESKSIYLMRRLPNPWELHKRCLTLPILGAFTALLLCFLLLLLYFGLYLLCTPAPCLTPHQWAKLWR